jgi:hypothetical protein
LLKHACLYPCAGIFHPKQISFFLFLLSFPRVVTELPVRRSPKTCRFGCRPLKPAAAVGDDVAVVVARIADNADAADFLSNWEQGKTN